MPPLRLRLHQPGISPFPGDEILMPSLLYYPSPIYDEDPVSIHHSAQPMSDHDGGATLSPFHQSLFDCPLVLCIQAGGGLIQDKYGRSLKKSSGDGDPLSLSAAETNSPLSHQGIIPLGQGDYKIMNAGPASDLFHLGIASFWPA